MRGGSLRVPVALTANTIVILSLAFFCPGEDFSSL